MEMPIHDTYLVNVTEETMKRSCPQIELPGWWWKKHFRKYRALRTTMQSLVLHRWMNGGYAEHQRIFKTMCDINRDATMWHMLNNGFSTVCPDEVDNKLINNWITWTNK